MWSKHCHHGAASVHILAVGGHSSCMLIMLWYRAPVPNSVRPPILLFPSERSMYLSPQSRGLSLGCSVRRSPSHGELRNAMKNSEPSGSWKLLSWMIQTSLCLSMKVPLTTGLSSAPVDGQLRGVVQGLVVPSFVGSVTPSSQHYPLMTSSHWTYLRVL